MISQPLENNIPDENSVNPCLVSLQMQLDAANSKIAELEKELAIAMSCNEALKKERDDLLSLSAMGDLKKSLAIRDIEQRAKGVEDFFKSHKPRIRMGKSAIWEVDDVLVGEAIAALKESKANEIHNKQ